ncbi:hypothetical protein V1519DRAFT_446154, partial [Lipomyces tetrasporus]
MLDDGFRHVSPSVYEVWNWQPAIRLGLLAFSSSIFLQWRDVRLSYVHFPATYRDCLVNSKF